MIGTGGGICTVARMLAGTADQAVLSQERVRALVAQLNALPLAERKQLPGLPADRADIIVAGGATYLVAMELLGAPEVTVSVRNLRYGLLVAGAA
jgi:exopolyphosphatase/guanosine-5'-triphosphate,3'-diphosphate pyrophosphatase